MTRSIYFWHGRNKQIEEKIAKICLYDAEKSLYYWEGTLDRFEEAYKGKFIVYPGQICVTQHSNFGQR